MAPPTDITCRAPRKSDLPYLTEIYNHAIRETTSTFDVEEKSLAHFQIFIPGDNLHRLLVAETGGRVVAYGGTYAFSQRKAYSQFAELMVYVHPDWQKNGIGKVLLREIHGGNFLRGLHTVLGLVNKENVPSQRLMDWFGYEYKGEMTDVAMKFGRRHSLMIYQRDVQPSQPNL